jgi:hypothetical protein
MKLLWRRADAVTVVGANALAAALLIFGWWGASRNLSVDRQLPWANLSAAGMIVAAIGNGLWIMAGRIAVGRRTRGLGAGDVASQVRRLTESQGAVTLVALPSLSLYHREDCSLMSGRDAVGATALEHQAAGRRPCGMCIGHA